MELTYQAQVTPWLSVQPDVQYIDNPSVACSIRTARRGATPWYLGYAPRSVSEIPFHLALMVGRRQPSILIDLLTGR